MSTVDLALLHASAVSLIPGDYRLRAAGDNNETTTMAIAAAAALLPFIGPALYCALRPALPVLASKEESA